MMSPEEIIKSIKEIDDQLKNDSYLETKSYICRFTGETINLPPVRKYHNSIEEYSKLICSKTHLINKAHYQGLIPNEEYKKYLLSTDDTLTPEIHL